MVILLLLLAHLFCYDPNTTHTLSSLTGCWKKQSSFQLPSMVLIKCWCISEKPWITLVLDSSSLCGILGFAKSRIEKANKKCLTLDLCTHPMCLHPESALICSSTGNWLLFWGILCSLEWCCSQPIRHLKCHEDLLPHFAVSIILLLIQKCYCVLWNAAWLYPRSLCSECLPFEVQTKSWAFQVLLHYCSTFLYIKTSVLGLHVCQ